MKLRHSLTLLALLGTLLCLGPAAQADPASPPSGDAFSLSNAVTRKVLPNGLVIVIKEQHEQNTVAVDMITRVGQAQEDRTNSGISDLIGRLLEHKVSHVTGQEDNVVETAGADLHYNVTPDFTEVALATTSEHFHPLFARVLGAYKGRNFTQKDMNTTRTELLQELEGEQRVFKAMYDIFLANFYRDHPYREPQEGSPDAVRALQLATLNHFYDQYYTPNHTVIAVVGDVDTQDILDRITRMLGGMPRVTDKIKTVQWAPLGSEKDLQLQAGSNLAWIFLGYPAPGVHSPDYAPMRVMHALMGEGVSSRLWVDLREDRGLAYELGSIYPVLQGPAHFLAYMITTPAQLHEARERMFKEMERLRTEDVPDAELEQGRWKVIGATLLQEETTSGKAFALASAEAQGVGYQFSDQFLHAVRTVTPQDVRRVANKYLDNYTLIVASPVGAH